jgi:hypothetical protein
MSYETDGFAVVAHVGHVRIGPNPCPMMIPLWETLIQKMGGGAVVAPPPIMNSQAIP